MKIYYNKNTKKFAGAGCIGSEFKEKKNLIIFLKVSEEKWLKFQKENHAKQIKVVDEKLIAEDIVLTLEQLKSQKINSRKTYRKQMFEEWFDDMENMPEEIKKKLKKEKDEIEEIKNAKEETINDY